MKQISTIISGIRNMLNGSLNETQRERGINIKAIIYYAELSNKYPLGTISYQ